MAWVDINKEAAKSHPLYGVKGWAALLVAYLIVKALFIYLVFVSKDPIVNSMVLISVAWLLTSSFLLIAHKKSFQTFLGTYWIITILGSLGTLLPDVSLELSTAYPWSTLGGRLLYGGVHLLWLGYIWKSARINVTCRNRVRRNDQFVKEEKEAYGVLSEELAEGGRDEKLWLKATVDADKSGRSPGALYAEYRLGQITAEEKEAKKQANKRANSRALWITFMALVAIVVVMFSMSN